MTNAGNEDRTMTERDPVPTLEIAASGGAHCQAREGLVSLGRIGVKFRRKPVVVEAWQHSKDGEMPDWLLGYAEDGGVRLAGEIDGSFEVMCATTHGCASRSGIG